MSVETKVNFNDVDTSSKSISHSKFDKTEWDSIEKTFPKEKPVIEMMKELGKRNISNQIIERKFDSCGEYYVYMRDLAIKEKYLRYLKSLEINKNKKKKNKKGGKHSKISVEEALEGRTLQQAENYLKQKKSLGKEQIKALNSIRSVLDSYKKDIQTNQSSNKCTYENNPGLDGKYIETRLLTFMKIMEMIMDKCDKGTENKMKNYELIASVDRIFKELKIIFKDDEQVIVDLRLYEKMFKEKINFSPRTLQNEYPRFIHPSKYDRVIPTLKLKPYETQIDLMNAIRNNKKTLSLYQVEIGGGKTSMIGALASYSQEQREVLKAKGENTNFTLIQVCSVGAVRVQSGRYVWNEGIPLGTATSKDGKKVEIVPNYRSRVLPRHLSKLKNKAEKDKIFRDNVVTILSDLSTALLILKEESEKKKKGEKYRKMIMFIDEPTVKAEENDNEITNILPYLIKYSDCCSHIILSSASLPPQEQLPKFLQLYKEVHNDGTIININSQQPKIGCEIISSNDLTIAPHTYSETKNDLKNVVKTINAQKFLGRLYTSQILYQLYDKLKEFGYDYSSLDDFFKDIDNYKQINIQKRALHILEYMIDNVNDDEIKKICKPSKRNNILNIVEIDKKEEESSEDDDDDLWEDSEEVIQETEDFNSKIKYGDINPEELATTKAMLYSGGCLIATHKPIEFAQQMGKTLLDGFSSLNSMIKKYETEMKVYQQTIEKIEKTKPSQDVKDPEAHKSKLIDKEVVPEFPFPDWAQINTMEHIKKFSDVPIDVIEKSAIRNCLSVDDININELLVPDWCLLLLYSGVGIYLPNCNFLTQQYNSTVLSLAEQGKLAYLISDDSINYGINIPINHVVIEDNFITLNNPIKFHSINTIFQLAGRAGRVGKSWVAYLHLGNDGINRILNYIHGRSDGGNFVEAINMEKAVDKMNDNIKKQLIADEEHRKNMEIINKLKKEKEEQRKKNTITINDFNKKNEEAKNKKHLKDVKSAWGVKKSPKTYRDNKSYHRTGYNRSYHNNNNNNFKTNFNRENNSNNEQKMIDEYKRLKKNNCFIPPHIKKIASKYNIIV